MRLEIRASEAFLKRLDSFAAERGMNRSQAMRAAVLEASPAAPGELPVAERDELLGLLGEAARAGSVPAIKALLDEHRRDAGAERGRTLSGGWIDELARRRTSGDAA